MQESSNVIVQRRPRNENDANLLLKNSARPENEMISEIIMVSTRRAQNLSDKNDFIEKK